MIEDDKEDCDHIYDEVKYNKDSEPYIRCKKCKAIFDFIYDINLELKMVKR